jgi:hypothetical protein
MGSKAMANGERGRLMPELATTRKDHRKPVFIHGCDDLIISDGSTGLDDGTDSGLCRQIDGLWGVRVPLG